MTCVLLKGNERDFVCVIRSKSHQIKDNECPQWHILSDVTAAETQMFLDAQ